jgi:hypothetical protein
MSGGAWAPLASDRMRPTTYVSGGVHRHLPQSELAATTHYKTRLSERSYSEGYQVGKVSACPAKIPGWFPMNLLLA